MTAGYDKIDSRDAPGYEPPKKEKATKKKASTALAVVTPDENALKQAAAGAGAALDALHSAEIDSDDRALWAGDMLHKVKAHWKELEEKRTAVTQPMNEALRRVNEMFKGVQGPLAQAEAILKQKIGAYQASCRAAQQTALVQAAAGDTAALALTAPAAPLPGVSVREVWDFEITNPDEVPRQFCSPDTAKIRAAITANPVHDKLVPQMPGVRVFKRSQVSSR